MKITPEDRQRFPHHTDDAILYTKQIEAMSTEELQKLIRNWNYIINFSKTLGKNTNPNWTKARIADVLYDRNELSEKEYDSLCGD